ncbi:MAG: hypothetical protein RR657_05005 [Peptostreptococcaceae bacterium]
MDLVEPKFMSTEYYYHNSGIKIRDDAPQWVKDEYEEFMKALDSGGIIYEE